MTIVYRDVSRREVDPKIIDGFKTAPTSMISDNLDRLPGAVGLRPFHRRGTMVGMALTVRTRAGDNLAIHQALELVWPDDVLVVDGAGGNPSWKRPDRINNDGKITVDSGSSARFPSIQYGIGGGGA